MNNHPNKAIRAAVDYALSHGWRLERAGPRAHIWGTLLCPRAERAGCMFHVHCTPGSPENHARKIRRAVDACQHGG